MPSKLSSIKQIEKYLQTKIPDQSQTKYLGKDFLLRAQKLLALLDNPQEKIKTIHVAGTSGKGSTAYLTSLLLKQKEFKVSFYQSPHILDIRERLQFNNKPLPDKKYIKYFNKLLPAIDKIAKSSSKTPTYFEILVAHAFYSSYKENVDYTILETGMGGTYDATNTIKRTDKVAIITNIGIDHEKILGDSIKAIAKAKADIIKKENLVISAKQKQVVSSILKNKAQKKTASLEFVKPAINLKNISIKTQGTHFDFTFHNKEFKNIKLGLIGEHQVQNAGLALASTILIGKRDGFNLTQKEVHQALKKAHLLGRLNIKSFKNKKIIFDGAHNPQKMKAFTRTLKQLFPKQKLIFIVAFKKGKNYRQMLKLILPLAKKIYITKFFQKNRDLAYLAEKPEVIYKSIKKKKLKKADLTCDSSQALKKSCQEESNTIVVTGSFYLISEILKKITK
jgi:dihydrofolate synthase/folylpolyglutamate synthase